MGFSIFAIHQHILVYHTPIQAIDVQLHPFMRKLYGLFQSGLLFKQGAIQGSQSEQSSFTYFILKGTEALTDCLILGIKGKWSCRNQLLKTGLKGQKHIGGDARHSSIDQPGGPHPEQTRH